MDLHVVKGSSANPYEQQSDGDQSQQPDESSNAASAAARRQVSAKDNAHMSARQLQSTENQGRQVQAAATDTRSSTPASAPGRGNTAASTSTATRLRLADAPVDSAPPVTANDRDKRQPPPPPDDARGCLNPESGSVSWREYQETQQAYGRPASNFFSANDESLRNSIDVSGTSPLYNHCSGISKTVMDQVLTGRQSNLVGAVANGLILGLADPATRNGMIGEIQRNQRIFRSSLAPLGPVGDYQPTNQGEFDSADGFINNLSDRFQRPVLRNDKQGFANVQFAYVGVRFGNGVGHAILIQQFGDARNFPNNQYQLYDSNFGVYTYNNFQDLATAIRNLWSNGYRSLGGITGAQYTGYSYQPARSSQLLPPGYPTSPSSSSSSSSSSSFSPSSTSDSSSDSSACASPLSNATNWNNFQDTLQAYVAGAASSFHTVNQLTIGYASGDNTLGDACAGFSSTALDLVTSGEHPDLSSAVDGMLSDLRDPGRRPVIAATLRRNEGQSQLLGSAPEHVTGYDLHSGASGQDAHGLVADLHRHFSGPQLSNDGRGLENQPLAVVNLSFRDPHASNHSILIQRVRTSNNYMTDRYELYDPNVGVVTYDGFDNLRRGLTNLFDRGYPQQGGVRAATTYYYADRHSRVDFPDASTTPDPLPIHSLGDLVYDNTGNGQQVPPDSHLPPPPSFDAPGPSGFIGGFGNAGDLKRSTYSYPLQPKAVFRPSNTSPEELKRRHGFFATSPTLENVNLHLHNYKMAADPGAIDGGGYLGTFYDRDIAQSHMKAMGDNGYIYYVAPSPNMVDTTLSLGPRHTRTALSNSHDVHEAAAMGSIDWTQVRGWQKVENGKLGEYQANPDYRWDVYDQTHTSGARPELAHFGVDDPAWSDPEHAPFVTEVSENGKTVYRPNEDPAATTVRFLSQARNGLQRVEVIQEYHNEYRGPITVKPVWHNNSGSVRLNFNAGTVSVNSSSGNSDEQFYFGNDGRIHSTHNYNRVLRIDGNGNAYVGAIPDDPNSQNGVFTYLKLRSEAGYGALIHKEDGKLLTEPVFAHTPFVAQPPEKFWRLLQRQQWYLTDPAGHQVVPPTPKSAFRGFNVGSENLLYQFYHDPNSALPKGATHFVTSAPGVEAGTFRNYYSRRSSNTTREDRKLYDYLSSHNAALLFRDGCYAITYKSKKNEPVLEVRRLDGTPVWKTTFPSLEVEVPEVYGNLFESNYSIPEETWEHVNYENDQYNLWLTRLTSPPVVQPF